MLDERFEGSHGSPDNHNIDAEKADRTWGMNLSPKQSCWFCCSVRKYYRTVSDLGDEEG